jgi:N-acetylneuraminate synthase/N,N'-diacetyllegionaminate synthase
LGARVLEKHFTLDKNMDGPDHLTSLEPKELKMMVQSIRNVELAISGTGFKEPSDSEVKNRIVARKSIHLNKDVFAGHIILFSDLIMKRPGDGISPMKVELVIGKRVNWELKKGDKLKIKDLKG